MHTRFVIFVAISAFLVGAIYSSSPHVVFGELKTSCTGTSKTTTHCTVFDTVTGDNPSFNCTYHKTSKSWSCVQAAQTGGSTNIPAGLKAAIVKAEAGAIKGGGNTGENNTNVPVGNALKHGGALKGSEQNNAIPAQSNDTLQ